MDIADLFSGLGATALAFGGIHGGTIAHPCVLCDSCSFSRALLAERAGQGYFGPRSSDIRIADDLRVLMRCPGDGDVQIVTGGFPCQDLSSLSKREGLSGVRSGLFYEIPRVADEFKADWVFLENVPDRCACRLDLVVDALHDIGFDCRWRCLSAAELGAPHERNRFFLLARRRDGVGSACVKLQSVAEVMQAARRWGWFADKLFPARARSRLLTAAECPGHKARIF